MKLLGSVFLLSLTNKAASLQVSVTSQTTIASDNMFKQRQLKLEKSPLQARFLKFAYKDKVEFILGYNDVTSIISLATCTGVYDKNYSV